MLKKQKPMSKIKWDENDPVCSNIACISTTIVIIIKAVGTVQ